MKVKVSRKAHFNAAHRLYRPEWSFEKNDNVFGLCNNPNFHGHNYELIVSVTGEIDKETGFVMDMKVLKELIREKIENQLDHKNLNVEVEWFKTLNPTAENIAVYIWNQLRPHIPASNELEVVLYETPRNYVTFSG
ncbi:6-carboxytetrahydropterin synthase [Arenibacter sp. S6351L]|uniref:6-pyruvoyl trahydropterin synthase family protein n=1 Tax=Arenibacter sp. S6351L TaxID=2926407 RepID=UPI001FF12DE4|nr:6-carboxytetrahydropterin synthase [Arenibacter sp. S6351L]MCK0137073.1 6-carboxytetrahydropterin synthase [Arenibacter sp. S6351L]